MGATSEAWAQEPTEPSLTTGDIVIDDGIEHGVVTVKSVSVTDRTVTITVTPDAGYCIQKSDIVVQKLAAPALAGAPRRAPDIADPLVVSGPAKSKSATDYTFEVPADYAGAWVTVTFRQLLAATVPVTPNSLTYTGSAIELVTLGTVVGTHFDSGTQLDADAPLAGYYTKSDDVYTPCSADDLADGETTYYKPLVTYSTTEDGEYSPTIPKGTNAGTYTVYYKYDADGNHADGSGSVTVAISKASITSVSLKDYVKKYDDGNAVTFSLIDENPVKAGEISVPSSDYDVSGDALTTQTTVGTYTCTVTAKSTSTNFTGSAFVNFRIVESTTVFIDSNSSPSDMAGTYVLTEDISASVLANLYSTTEAFTGELDGNFHKITDLSAPLFNTINGGTVKNVILDNVGISSGTNVGAIANKMTGTSTNKACIYNCGVLSGNVSGSGYVGSIVGQLGDSNDDNCYARVINCYSYATVGGGSEVGGIVGYNDFASTAANIRTMVMNCMFYGDITSGTNVSPVYGGENINNLQGGLNTFNYYSYEKSTTFKARTEGDNKKYNCALAVEEKYLNRFEFYRQLLNSNKKLAAFYATGSHDNANQMAKWVLETADRTIETPKPYPILKAQGYYPSIINPDFANAPDSTIVGRNKGGKLGKTLSVTISGVGSNAPSGASISKGSLTLQRTDKDFDRFNFNYDKVQLPYYNDVGTGNYTGNRVVTGWKIMAITTVDGDPYTAANYDYTKTYASDQAYFDYPNYNFADRKSSNKDLYSVSGRVFSQGAYFDVPYGVTSITIEPYWGKAYYIADANYDVVYKDDYSGKQNVTQTGTQVKNDPTQFNGQKVETSITRALDNIANNLGGLGSTVYDNALVLVGNLHLDVVPLNGNRPFTMMSVDEDNDHEPDYSLIYHHKSRSNITPIRFDFLTVPGTAQAQKPNGASLICNFTIFKTRGWFEVTNTAFMYSSQIEYENGALGDGVTKIDAPLILEGGIFDQFVSTQSSTVDGHTIYIHVGSNVWINSFGLGTHSDGEKSTPHVPVSVTGGDYEEFYLTGTYNANSDIRDDNAECYISGGRFGEVAGAALEQIGNNTTDNGNVHWQIYNADITSFFGGGINDAKPVKGNITTDIFNSNVTLFCGGPKFGNMTKESDTDPGKSVTTTAIGCTFGKYFGAGYGGTSLSRKKYYDESTTDWDTWDNNYTTDRGKYFDGQTTNAVKAQYGKKGLGVATDFDYEFFVWSTGTTGGRFFVKFASFSLAQCNDVESTLKKCIIETNFYGGGNLGKVVGTATSVLEDCTVKGSVYGAGYSASLPTVEVRDAGFTTYPNYNSQSGMFEPAVPSGTTTFTWQNAAAADKTLTNGNPGSDLTNHILYTNTVLTNLGEVKDTKLTINGTTTVAGSVYGGGEESAVDHNTEVIITSGTIGAEGKGGAEFGNVYGGGKGKDDEVKGGLVKGNTKVTISQAEGKSTIVYHNVYGGGAYGSVGTYSYDDDVITGHTANTGKAEVIITGGTFGWNGKENGMVFGSSRGDVGAPYGIEDKMAWVYDTEVKIGTPGQGFGAPQPQIKGSVYGGGENGHNYHNANVYIYSGTIGIAEGSPIVDNNGTPDNTEDDITYRGAEYAYRGNVYGGGCGTDKYYSGSIPDGHTVHDGMGDKYNPLAGIVRGDATITMTGGRVVRNIYGAGAMGSVGTADVPNSGNTTITISGGTVGVDGTVGDGNVFGAARGSAEATCNEFALVRKETNVSVTGGAIKGNVYGGGELGCVGTFTISDGMRTFTWQDTDGNTNTPANTNNKNTGICNVNISGGEIGTGVAMSEDGMFANGNVFGAGKGQGDTFWCEKGIVYKANVSITDGIVNGHVFGGGEVGRVETDATVKVGPETGIGSPEVKGHVFGGGAGLKTHGYSALVRGNTYVTVQSSAKVSHNVYGGGMIAAVGKYYLVTAENLSEHPGLSVGMPYSLVNDGLGICNVTVKGDADITGSVFGGGKGKKPDNLNFAEPSGADYHTDSYDIDDHMPKRMMNDYAAKNTYWEYTDPDDHTYIWEYFETPAKYHTFLETLGLTTQSVVNIEGSAQVNGNVYGGSESGFVQHNTSVTIAGGTIGTGTAGGNVFGGGLGLETFAEAGRVRGNASVTINGGAVKGNVYGGGQLGDVGTIDKTDQTNYNYTWTDVDGNSNGTNESKNTGVCTVTINGGTIGTDVDPSTDGTYANGNVYGAGKGKDDTYWCEKAIVYKTNVTVTDGTINGTVYGGGEVGRVETDGITTIGKSGETGTGSKPYIKGNVFGAGAGVKTHGYSALLRGNSTVIVQGIAKVGHSVYGGGEIASVGRFNVDPETQLPTTPKSGGTCTVTIQGSAEIGSNGEGYVFGACKGVTPSYNYSESETTYDYRIANFSKRMVTYDPNRAENPHDDNSKGSFWDPYPDKNTENPSFVWEYFTTEPDYKVFLNTLALTSNTKVTIGGDASVNGSVFGGGERGITLGSVVVNIVGGNVTKDVYGGGALADSNAGNVTGYGTSSATISSTSTYTTTVNLLGGTVNDAYGGALGQKVGDVNGGTSDVEAFVYGDVNVNLNGLETSDYIATDHESYVTDVDDTDGTYYRATDGCIVTGSVFGCNNINGTPKGHTKVHVFKTVSAGHSHGYDVTSVFGGGNAADYVPEETDTKQSTEVIIEGCELTSIEEVYGGGYGAAVPGTSVLVKGTKIIDNVFGGGYGAGENNPGANVGYYTSSERAYGKTGTDVKTAVVRLMAGKINNVYGGSNTQGNIRGGSSVTNTTNDGSPGCCDALDVGKIFGGGKSAAMYGGAEIVLGCMPNDWISEIYAGADQADVGNDVSLTITSGKFGRVFGGNNTSGTIGGSIEVNIEENPNCGTPIIIGELYGGGNQAAYTVPQNYINDWKTQYGTDYPSPRVNVRAFTSIGNIYGGGLGTTAIVKGNPTVNINEVIVTDGNGTNHAYDPSAADTGRPAFINGVDVKLYPHEAGKMGVIGNVFGGGNAAQVDGNTYVNIGTTASEEFVSVEDDDTTTDVNEHVKTVVGADIRGNVYGAGNNAEVTGNTNVNIGKKVE